MCRCRPISNMPTPPGRRALPDRVRAPRRRRGGAHRRAAFRRRAAGHAGRPRCPHAFVTLHVGAGTFQPVKTGTWPSTRCTASGTRFRPRPCRPSPTARPAAGGSSRWARPPCARWRAGPHSGQTCGDTDIFITPGFDFKLVDLLITNFHLPKSSLMMLVSAFAGYDAIRALYRTPLRSVTASSATAMRCCCSQHPAH
jgi:hypothetical protein